DKVVFKQYDFDQRHIKANTNIMVDNEVRGIYADNQNRLWMGTKGEELVVFKDNIPIDNLLEEPIPFKSGVYSIIKDKEGAMWFGTKSNGLFKAVPLDATEQKYKLTNHYFENDILENGGDNSIYTILQDSK